VKAFDDYFGKRLKRGPRAGEAGVFITPLCLGQIRTFAQHPYAAPTEGGDSPILTDFQKPS